LHYFLGRGKFSRNLSVLLELREAWVFIFGQIAPSLPVGKPRGPPSLYSTRLGVWGWVSPDSGRSVIEMADVLDVSFTNKFTPLSETELSAINGGMLVRNGGQEGGGGGGLWNGYGPRQYGSDPTEW
jgi:bacteriocin-like protein